MDCECSVAENIERLPDQECVAYAMSMTTPADAFKSSPAFRSAADSDHAAILAGGGECGSKKELFARLCGQPVLLDDDTMSFRVDRRSGAKCVMLSARALSIAWGDDPSRWRWVPGPPGSRFPEVAELLDVCWLEITGKLSLSLLSPSTTYAAYLVYTFADYTTGLDCNIAMPTPKSTLSIISSSAAAAATPPPAEHKICLTHAGDDERIMHRQELVIRLRNKGFGPARNKVVRVDPDMDIRCPRRREDDGECGEEGLGWMEVELGEFAVAGVGEDDDGGDFVEVSFREESGRWKTGLIVQGIELRPKCMISKAI